MKENAITTLLERKFETNIKKSGVKNLKQKCVFIACIFDRENIDTFFTLARLTSFLINLGIYEMFLIRTSMPCQEVGRDSCLNDIKANPIRFCLEAILEMPLLLVYTKYYKNIYSNSINFNINFPRNSTTKSIIFLRNICSNNQINILFQ